MTIPLRIAPPPTREVLSPLDSMRKALIDPRFQGEKFFPDKGDLLFWKPCSVNGCNEWAANKRPTPICNSHRYRLLNEFGRDYVSISAERASVWVREQSLMGPTGENKIPEYDFSKLPPLLAAEVKLLMQERAANNRPLERRALHILLKAFAENSIKSVFDAVPNPPLEIVVNRTPAREIAVPAWLNNNEVIAMLRDLVQLSAIHYAPVPVFQREAWSMEDWGIANKKGLMPKQSKNILFYPFRNQWLKAWVKRYAQYLIQVGRVQWVTVEIRVKSLRVLDRYITEKQPQVRALGDLNRDMVLDFILWCRTKSGVAQNSYRKSITSLGLLIDVHNTLGWQPKLQRDFKVLGREAPERSVPVPQPLDPRVVDALMDPAFLALVDRSIRNMLIISRHCGLRPSSLATLAFDPIRYTTKGANLEYLNMKRARAPLQPIREKAVLNAIKDQQELVQSRFPNGCPWLFPAKNNNRDGSLRHAEGAFGAWMKRWIDKLGVVDENGEKLQFTWSRMRDTVATEMLNAGHDPLTVARWLDHKDLNSLQHYAEYHADTLRKALDDGPMINVQGRVIEPENTEPQDYDADALRARMDRHINTVPGGTCNLPAREACPTPPMPCYSCAHFGTGPSKIPELLGQFKESEVLLMAHQHAGRDKARVKELHVTRDMRAVTRVVALWMRNNRDQLTAEQAAFMDGHKNDFDAVIGAEGEGTHD